MGTCSGMTLMAHWDGANQQRNFFPSPNVGTGTNRLWAVAALGPEDILAVGEFSNSQGQTLIEEYT